MHALHAAALQQHPLHLHRRAPAGLAAPATARPALQQQLRPMACAAAAPAQPAAGVQAKVAEWLGMDRDAASRAVVEALVARNADAELEELVCKRLEFGARAAAVGMHACCVSCARIRHRRDCGLQTAAASRHAG